MKQFYRLSGSVNRTLVCLGLSLVFSFGVMMFINIFVGGMGGIPAFAGFFCSFYRLRPAALSGRRISHQLAMESRTEVRYFLTDYGAGYLLVWGIMKLVHLLSRISGWGNIDGLTMEEYLNHIYGSTMLERWAYLFAGILMFSYVMSLFPLVLIRRKKIWVIYLLADHAVFAAVCGGIAAVCRFFIVEGKRNWGRCVLDDLLLCELPERWEAAAYLLAAVFFCVLVIILVYKISVRAYAPKPGTLGWKQEPMRTWKAYCGIIAAAAAGILLFTGGVGYFFFGNTDHTTKYEKVAEYLTEDSVLGPMVYRDSVYIPVESDADLTQNGVRLGYLGEKNQNCDSRFYELVIANLLYRDDDVEKGLLQVMGADFGSFRSAEEEAERAQWKEDEIFLLWDEDWLAQTAYSNATGYSVCEKALIESLQEQFGDVPLHPEDFSDYDAYFTIRGYEDMKAAVETEETMGHWVGCILVKDNQFYYGNYDSRIEGKTLQLLLEVLGGN